MSVYAPALDAGVITPASVIDDYPVEMLGGSIWPVNAYSGYRSIMTLQDAIRNSSNPTAVRTAIKLTLARVVCLYDRKLKLHDADERRYDRGRARSRSAAFPRA